MDREKVVIDDVDGVDVVVTASVGIICFYFLFFVFSTVITPYLYMHKLIEHFESLGYNLYYIFS